MESRILTIYFDDEKYYDICRLIFDHYWYRPNIIQSAIKASHIEGNTTKWAEEHQEEWSGITGCYAGENGKIIYRVKQKKVDEIRKICELLKEAGILKNFQI